MGDKLGQYLGPNDNVIAGFDHHSLARRHGGVRRFLVIRG